MTPEQIAEAQRLAREWKPTQLHVVQNWFEELQRLVPTDR